MFNKKVTVTEKSKNGKMYCKIRKGKNKFTNRYIRLFVPVSYLVIMFRELSDVLSADFFPSKGCFCMYKNPETAIRTRSIKITRTILFNISLILLNF